MDDVISWLMEGDPVIRWQTMRNLPGLPECDWQAERQKTVETGWGKQFIDALLPDFTWAESRWTGTVWTLLVVMDCGLPYCHPSLHRAAIKFLDTNLTESRSRDEKWLLGRMDLCHLGFWLRIGAYFLGQDERLARLTETILKVQLDDGGWNCRIRNYPKTIHSSFHTTFNVLEGLTLAADAGIVDRETFRTSEARALEFMLQHQLYRSDKTGEIVEKRLTYLTYPSHWHYNILRGLDYMRSCPEIADCRLSDPIALLESRCNPKGRWVIEKRYAGAETVEMEKFGGESRWNTLRAMRVLKARADASAIPRAYTL